MENVLMSKIWMKYLEDELKKLKLPQQHQDKEISTSTKNTVVDTITLLVIEWV
jgi:hypothetical protein